MPSNNRGRPRYQTARAWEDEQDENHHRGPAAAAGPLNQEVTIQTYESVKGDASTLVSFLVTSVLRYNKQLCSL
jgi:hypothetical protein